MTAQDAPAAITQILPGRWSSIDWRDLWRFRELFRQLVWRDVKIRYKQTIIGFAWAVFQPLLTMAIFTLFFGRLAQLPSDGLPHHIFYLSGLVLWTYFSNALSQGANVLVQQQNMIKKIYFPRLYLPATPVFTGLLDLALAVVVLLVLLLGAGFVIHTRMLVALPIVLLASILALGINFWLSALNARWRDVRLTIPFLLQVWMFASPLAYPASMVPDRWAHYYSLNPMVGIVEGFRWCMTGQGALDVVSLAIATVSASVVFITGMIYFQSVDSTIADVV